MPCEPGSQSNHQTTTNAGSAPSDGSATHPNFLEMGIGEARREKWDLGRLKYGPVFKTNPLIELDEELLDSMNYVEEAARQGYPVDGLFAKFYNLCVEVREIIRGFDSKTAKRENG